MRTKYYLLFSLMFLSGLFLASPAAAASGDTCLNFSGQPPAGPSTTCTLQATSVDPEGDQIYYIYTWGDGSANTRMPATGTVASGTKVSADHTFNYSFAVGEPNKIFSVYVVAYDEANNQSDQSDPVTVTIINNQVGVTFQAVDDIGSAVLAPARWDGTLIGTTPTAVASSLGSHTASFDEVICYTLSGINPLQPMTVNGSTTVTATYNRSMPGQAATPAPVSGATGQDVDLTLSWQPNSCTASYQVYFGNNQTAVTNATAASPEYKGSQAGASYLINSLNFNTNYYWRIDTVNSKGTTKSNVWSFTTGSDRSAILAGTPNTGGWTKINQFTYTATCTPRVGSTLQFCTTYMQIDDGSWTISSGSPYTMYSGGRYIYRTTEIDTLGTVNSNIIPSVGYIQVDTDIPIAGASCPSAQSSGPSIIISGILIDQPDPNSGILNWDLQYRKGELGTWTNCRTGIPGAQSSLNFGSECTTPVSLEENIYYYFRARGKDVAGNQSSYSAFDCSVLYELGNLPNTPTNPQPVDGGYIPATSSLQSLEWNGGDPDVTDALLYGVYISQGNQSLRSPLSLDLDGYLSKLPNSQNPVVYGKPNKSLTPGETYQWKVSADDTQYTTPPPNPSPIPATREGRPVWGATWNFKVNRPIVISNVTITPVPAGPVVNRQASIEWDYNEPDLDQVNPIFTLYYNDNQTISGASIIADDLTKTICTGTHCTYLWDSKCVGNITNQYVVVGANDGYDDSAGASAATFEVNHTEHYYFPVNNASAFGTVNNGVTVDMQISQGSMSIADRPAVIFKGACTSTINPQIQANSGTPVKYEGSLDSGEATASQEITGLAPNQTNKLKFQVEGCARTQYQIRYTLDSFCGEPFLKAEQGTIYSQNNIRSTFAPRDNFNATYMIMAGGNSSQAKVIENFIAGPPVNPEYVRPDSGVINFPNISSTGTPGVNTFDYFSLTHSVNGLGETVVIGDGETNLYGFQVKKYTPPEGLTVNKFSETLNTVEANPLAGKVYYFTGDLEVDQNWLIKNGILSQTGVGLIIVDGNMMINNNITYENTNYSGSLKNLASVGFVVRGNVVIAPGVTQIVGNYYVAGSGLSGGEFMTGDSGDQLVIYGAVIAKKLVLARTYSAGNEPAEKVISDGRININTPPGFSDLLKTLPTWRLRAP